MSLFMSVDIHGMTCAEAKKFLESKIRTAPKHCELTVIHGYRGGHALMDMVRKDLKSTRIKRKILGLNQGETILVLE